MINLPPPYDGATCRNDKDLKSLKHFPHYSTNACFEECLLDYVFAQCGCRYLFSSGKLLRDLLKHLTKVNLVLLAITLYSLNNVEFNENCEENFCERMHLNPLI